MNLAETEIESPLEGETEALGEETGSIPETTDPEIPQAYKRPQSVLVVVFTRVGEFLLLRRTKPTDFWQSVTGSRKPGEGARATALRELWEETGLRVSPSHLLDLRHSERFPIHPAWRDRYAPGVHYNLEHWFALPLPGRRLIRVSSGEHLEYRWLPAGRAAAMATSWSNRNAIFTLAQTFQPIL